MARKNLLKGLMEDAAARKPDTPQEASDTPAPASPAPHGAPRYSKGAIGAVSKSIAELKSRSVIEIDPFSIKAGGLADRLEHDAAGHASLMDSIREYGQQVPVLVRPDPEEDGAYQIVYGRRRVLALRDLGQPVKAMVRDLDDQAAILAQGQENSARRDLSFIERVNFARQMVEAGYERKVIADALSTDKTLISRMLSVSDTLPVGLIEAIGAAPSVGRDRWLAFARLWADDDRDDEDVRGMLAAHPGAETSDKRFEVLMAWLERRAEGKAAEPAAEAPAPARKSADRAPLTDSRGRKIGQISRTDAKTKIEITRKQAAGFDDWLAEHLEEIHRTWLKSTGGE